MSHTQGPWQVDHTADGEHMAQQLQNNPSWLAVEVVDEDVGGHVAYCHVANASLIASAPDLLSALKYMVENAESEGWSGLMMSDAVAAIAKAEGRE